VLTRPKVRGRVRHWQHLLGLDHWSIRLKFAPKTPEKGDHASVQIPRADWDADYLEAIIYFDLLRIPERGLDSYILHELAAHPVWWPMSQLAYEWAGNNRRLRAAVRRHEEQSTVMLERVLCRAFGVTPWNDLAKDAA
jgi:hypothetical protein